MFEEDNHGEIELTAAAGLDATFAALSDPTRRAILVRLASSQTNVSDLARPFSISLPAISKHLRVLESAGLIVRKKEGRNHKVALLAAPMKEATEWMSRYSSFWEKRLDAFEESLDQTANNRKEAATQRKARRRMTP